MTIAKSPGTVDWPSWETAAFWAQDLAVIADQMAVQRRQSPVHWYEPDGSWVLANDGFWVLSKWEDERYVESNPDLFTTRFGSLMGDAVDPASIVDQLPAWAREELAEPDLTAAQKRGIVTRGKQSIGGRKGTEAFIVLDPPEHDEVRGIFMQALRPSRVRKLRGFIGELTDERLDGIEAGVEVDFVPALAKSVPAGLMCEMVGVPRDMWGRFAEWADALIASTTVTPDRDPAEVARLKDLGRRYVEYVESLLEERRGSEGEDMFSVVTRSELRGEPLDTNMLIMYITMLIEGGSDTSGHLISFLIYALATRPDQLALLQEHPELIGNAIEETLRYYPIVWLGCRTAVRDVEIRGTTIREGEYVLSSYMSANRDEEVWERPDEFDITRSFDAGHLAFGYGQHACPGGQLTRVEVTTVLERILERFKGWKLAGDPVWQPSPFVNGVSSLPLVFEE